MSHYTVGYLDETRHHQDICVTANDSWEARSIAEEDVPYLHQHPNSIDCILVEGSKFGVVR